MTEPTEPPPDLNYPLRVHYYQPDGTKVSITTDQANGHLPTATCKVCNQQRIYVNVVFDVPNLAFALAGYQMKFSARRKVYLSCAGCETKSGQIDWP